MRLYPKRLNSIADLEREKKRLLKEKKQLDKEEFLSLKGITGKNKAGNEKGDEWSVIDLLPISNPFVSLILKKVLQRFSKKEDIPDRRDDADDTGDKPRKSLLYRGAVEFIGGYLKWKAIELSYKGIRYLLKKRDRSGKKGDDK